MRTRPIIAAFLALFAAAPAAADITARYVSGMNVPMALTVQANDRGDSRLAMGNQMAALVVDGVAYVVMADLSGTFVVRQDDMLAVMAEQFRAAIGDVQGPPRELNPEPAYRVVERGTEIVGGRSGTVVGLRTPGQENQPGLDFVVNTDPDLAPIGRAIARQFGGQTEGIWGMFGPGFESQRAYAAALQSIFERGTVIRMGRVMRLDTVDDRDLPDSLFTLPSAPLSREQFAARSNPSASQR
ncbi:MAG TPA: hypothetical protein VK614_06300 [Allosphingosinicella sp.]|nr:hypothetical protein [Allosphingosinicella sp.]